MLSENFLLNNFLGSSTPIGQQYLNVDVAGQKNRENAGIDDVSLKGIIDSIKRVGTPGSENKPDGVWKTRTNNAIKNIYALTYAIFNAAKTMNLTLPNLDEGKLNEFKALVPQKYTDVPANEIGDRAGKLAETINSMSQVFSSFQKFVLENKQYSQYINQQAAFTKYEKRKENKNGNDVLDKDEQAIRSSYTKPIHVQFSNVRDGRLNWFNLSDLENMNTLAALMQKIGEIQKIKTKLS